MSVSRSPGLGSSVSSSPQSDRSGDPGDRLTWDESGISSSQDLVSGESQVSIASSVICKAEPELSVIQAALSAEIESTVPGYRIVTETQSLGKSDISVEHVAEELDGLLCEEPEVAPVSKITSNDRTIKMLPTPSLTVTDEVKIDEISSDNLCQSTDGFLHERLSNTEDLCQSEVRDNGTRGSPHRNSSEPKEQNDTEDVTLTLLKYVSKGLNLSR